MVPLADGDLGCRAVGPRHGHLRAGLVVRMGGDAQDAAQRGAQPVPLGRRPGTVTSYARGGLSTAPVEDYFNASLAGALVGLSGIGGFNPVDLGKLLAGIRKLLQRGASVVVIEHNLDVIAAADWIIDLGPEGGEDGGYVVASGTPEQVVKVPESYTGKFLQDVLANGRTQVYAQRS